MAACGSSEKSCPICLEIIAHDNLAYTHDCGHSFCFGCIREWTKKHRDCPLCRKFVHGIIHNIRSEMDYTVDRLCFVVEPFTSLNPTNQTIAEYRLMLVQEQVRNILQTDHQTSMQPADRGQLDAVQQH